MIELRKFPTGQGITFTAVIAEETNGLKVADFAMSVDGTGYNIVGAEFVMDKGDTIYITPAGLEKIATAATGTPQAQPSKTFPNGSAYWLASKVDDTKYTALEVTE